ncbi:MAG: DNA polymerase III subunit delta [Acutalibacteraceae bacterium]|nr:DNA polymerase III subunit delta [Acutalibacteraceae bacterium]
MAVCNESHIKNDIKLSAFAPCYIIYGNDGYLKRQNALNIVNAVVDTEDIFNFQKFVGECSLQEVYDAKEQLPLMADKKCILIEDYDFLDCSASDFEKLLQICGEKSEDCVVVLLFTAIDFDLKKLPDRFKKLVSATEKCGGRAVLINHRQTGELVKTVIGACEKRGCSMRSDVARFFIDYVSSDTDTIINEIEKLCAYKKSGSIDIPLIKKICIQNIEQSIYDLSAKIIGKDVGGALTLLDELLYMRIKPLMILSTVSSVYVDALRVYAAKKDGTNMAEFIEKFGYSGRSFLIDKAVKNLSILTVKQLKISIDELCRADNMLKSFSGEDRIVLEELIVRLSYIASKGESIDKN